MLDYIILAVVLVILKKVWNMSDNDTAAALEALRGEVTETRSAVDAAVILLNGLSNRLKEALMRPDVSAAIRELRDELDGANKKLATAVAENTGAAEDSDDVYDPNPIGDAGNSSAESVDGSQAVPEPAATDGDSTSSETTAESDAPTGNVFSGEGAIGEHEAVDTSATTTEPTYQESAGNVAGSDSSDENGKTEA